MIDDQSYKEILEKGLLLDHYFLLCNLKHNKKMVQTKRIQGFINLLTKKDYIKEGVLTEKGLNLVENCGFSEIVPVETTKKGTEEAIDFGTWVAELHKRLQEKLYSLTRLRQIRAKLEKRSYNFIPNSTDLGKALYKVITLYKIKDYDKIEKALMNHIENCAKNNDWFPLMQYYIIKNGASQMVTEIQNPEDMDDQDYRSTQKFV